jgi:hypothetical protein
MIVNLRFQEERNRNNENDTLPMKVFRERLDYDPKLCTGPATIVHLTAVEVDLGDFYHRLPLPFMPNPFIGTGASW